MHTSEEFTYKEPSNEELLTARCYFDDLLHKFCDKTQINYSTILVDEEAITDAFVRIDKRRDYYCYFHNGMTICEFKESALLAYWINKLHPLFIKDDNSDINEQFATYVILSAMEFGNFPFFNNPEYVKKLKENLSYTFRFRTINQEAFITMLEPIYLKCLLEKKVNY